jgi:hypothetical protein
MRGRAIRVAVSGGRVYASFKSPEEFAVYRTTGFGCSVGGQLESGWERGWRVGSDLAPVLWSFLYAHPGNRDIVYATGTDFWRSTNGGRDFSVMTGPHVDHHAFAVDPSNGDVVYTGCDGGIYRSDNRGAGGSWSFVGAGMTNTEFYDIGQAPTDARLVLGGTQDNGTIRIQPSGTVWDEIRGGDGATVDVDPTNAGVLYSMGQFASSIARRAASGWEGLAAGLPVGSECFNLHYHVHPRIPATLLASCKGKLWRTLTNQPPGDWRVIFPVTGSPTPAGGVVRSAVDGRSNTYYAATDAGELWAGVDGSGWQRVFNLTTDCGAPATGIVDVEVDVDDPAVVYLATNARGTCRVVRLRRPNPGALPMTAQDITFDLPADVLPFTLAIDRMNPGTIYVGTTDRAIYRGRLVTGTPTWRWDRYSDGLPLATCVVELLVHPVAGVLRAGTCGRGAFEVDTDHPVGSILAIEGVPTFLRVHDVGSGFGPPADFIDGEVVVQVDSAPGRSFGFQLRADQNEAARKGMLDTLRTAFNAHRRVRLDYRRTGIKNGVLIRVAELP